MLTLTAVALANGNLLPTANAESGNQPTGDTETEAEHGPAPLPEAEIALSVEVTDTAPTVGDAVVFTVTVENTPDTGGASDVIVEALLPPGVVYSTHAVDQGAYDVTSGTWSVGDVLAASVVRLWIAGNVTTTEPVTLTPSSDAVLGNQTGSLDDPASITIQAVSPPTLQMSATIHQAGELTMMSLVLSNPGDSDATDVAVSTRPPGGLQYEHHDAEQGDYDVATGTWTVGTLPSGGHTTLVITASEVPLIAG